jgi:FliW protein
LSNQRQVIFRGDTDRRYYLERLEEYRTVRDRVEDITVNLQGPLIINSISLRGTQLVVEEYPVRYPLLRPTAQ